MKVAHALSAVRESAASRAMRDLRERRRRVVWPSELGGSPAGDRVAIVVVNHNTRELIAQLLFSVHRILGRDQVAEVVVVDNASSDGSAELLEALARAGLIHLIANDPPRYHGSGLNQGVSWLATRQASVSPEERVDYIWILDSDTLVLRRDTVARAIACLSETGAAVIGESFGERDGYPHLTVFTLMFDPVVVWRHGISPFRDDGVPEKWLLESAGDAGMRLEVFPFLRNGSVLHLGSGTLREVAHGDWTNRFYGWSQRHANDVDFTYTDHPLGRRIRQQVLDVFADEVGELTPAALVNACASDRLLVIPMARSLPSGEVLQQLWESGVNLEDYLLSGSGEDLPSTSHENA